MTPLSDRIEGVLLGSACGAAMKSVDPDDSLRWADDFGMAICAAFIAYNGGDLHDKLDLTHDAAQDELVQRWYGLTQDAEHVDAQTAQVLRAAVRDDVVTAAGARAAARALHESGGLGAGSGALMRTAPIAIAFLDDEMALVRVAREICETTHADPDAVDACVLLGYAIRHAVLTTKLDIRIGLGSIVSGRRALWRERIDAAEVGRPGDFTDVDSAVSALQAAWSAISTTPVLDDDAPNETFCPDYLRLAREAAQAAGPTAASSAGALLGAAYGASAVPAQWTSELQGWPGMPAQDLIVLAGGIERKGAPAPPGTFGPRYDYAPGVEVRHPSDDEVLLGDVGALREISPEVDAVVSLGPVSSSDAKNASRHTRIRMADSPSRAENPHLEFVMLQAVKAVERYRAKGYTVLLHDVDARNRMPAVAALYDARRRGISIAEAERGLAEVLPGANPYPEFRQALRRFET
jgi:ADP-ribosylglycohydrolase